jgi:hypothetical protein
MLPEDDPINIGTRTDVAIGNSRELSQMLSASRDSLFLTHQNRIGPLASCLNVPNWPRSAGSRAPLLKRAYDRLTNCIELP